MAIGAIGILIDMFVYANKYDREKLVKSRRQERLKALMADESILLKNEGKLEFLKRKLKRISSRIKALRCLFNMNKKQTIHRFFLITCQRLEAITII